MPEPEKPEEARVEVAIFAYCVPRASTERKTKDKDKNNLICLLSLLVLFSGSWLAVGKYKNFDISLYIAACCVRVMKLT